MASDVDRRVSSIDYESLKRPWEDAVLEAIRVTPSLRQACLAAKVSRVEVEQWAKKCSRFAMALDEAREDGIDESIEGPLLKKAHKGDTKAAIFLLEHLRPQVYGAAARTRTGETSRPVSFTLNIGGPVGELDTTPAVDVKQIEAPTEPEEP